MTQSTDPECDFCEIVSREDDDAREVFRTPTVVAFFPLEPATLGHTLLVPRAHVQDIWHLDGETAAELGRWTVILASAVRDALQPEGLNVIQSNGAAATQTVLHLHVHVLPRWRNDAIGAIWPPDAGVPERQVDSAWDALREEFRARFNT